MNPDGISYIEVGEAYLRGNWSTAVNGYWSPLYPWLLGVGLKLLRPAPYWEFPAVHLINFLIYLATLGCFRFFWTSLIRYHAARRVEQERAGLTVIPESVWLVLGYTIFLVSALEFIGLQVVAPDMCLAAFVYIASGLILRIRTVDPAGHLYLLLGIVLGFGYLSKPAMMPLSATFILASLPLASGIRRNSTRAAVALVGLTLVAAPYIALLSHRLGYVTYSEAGKLAYAWVANRASYHWVGELAGSGTPVHPRKRIFDHPSAFQFENAGAETYPGWYDPAYWVTGLKPRFDLRQQASALKRDTEMLFELFFSRFSIGLLIFALTLYFASGAGVRTALVLAEYWFLLLPSLAAVATFWFIWVEPRYIGPFAGLFWAGLISGLRLPDEQRWRKLLVSATSALLCISVAVLMGAVALEMDFLGTSPPMHWQVAQSLHEMGIREGDGVAAMGRVLQCGWARLARVRITAEIPHEAEPEFRTARPQVQSDAILALLGTGARAVIADDQEPSGCASGWRPAGKTGFYVCLSSVLTERGRSSTTLPNGDLKEAKEAKYDVPSTPQHSTGGTPRSPGATAAGSSIIEH
jgi:hypothetical protein